MRDATFLLAVTPPRTSPVTLAGQAQMLAGLAHVRRAARRGVAVEIVGEGGHVRFLARAANDSARAALEGALAGYYPQGSAVPLLDLADDPARVGPGEGAVAAELRLRQRPELPLKIPDRAGTTPAVEDPSAGLQRVIGALRRLDGGTRGVCQLILWPGPRRWGSHIARERDRAIARERALGAAREEDVEYLMRHPGQVLSRTLILERVWDYGFDSFANVVDATVRRLRKVVDEGYDTPLIHTVRGVGYKIKAS